MKKITWIPLAIVMLCTNVVAQTKTFTGYITQIVCVDNCDLFLGQTPDASMDKTQAIRILYDTDGSAKVNKEAKNYFTVREYDMILKPEYASQKFTIICTVQGQDNVVNSIVPSSNNSTQEKPTVPTNLFTKASAKVSEENGDIQGIVENNLVYRVHNGIQDKKAKCSELPIKNGNQFFSTKGGYNDYLKVVIDNAGIAKFYCASEAGEIKYLEKSKLSMKEIKEGFIIGKIVGNKFCLYEKGKYTVRGYVIQGNKTQAVICILATDYFR